MSAGLTTFWGTIAQGLELGLADLIALDWEEIEEDQEASPLSVNWSHYRTQERIGALQSLFMTLDGKLIGYNVFFVHCPAHHSLTKWAIGDLIYLDPEHRLGTRGLRLIAEPEQRFRTMSVRRILYTVKVRGSVGELLQRCGYAPYEASFAKLL
jgi:GNAT superfamily N-acetyltransferase